MRISAFKSLTTIFVVAGVFSPIHLCAQTTSQKTQTFVVVEQGLGITQGLEWIQDASGSLAIKSAQTGSVGVEVKANADFEGFAASLSDPETFKEYPLAVDLSDAADSVGIYLNQGADLSLGQVAQIKAHTAIRGTGTLYLSAYPLEGVQSEGVYEMIGGLEMKQGTIQNDFGSRVHYVGMGDLGTYRAFGGTLEIGTTKSECAESFVRIGSLELADGANVVVSGDRTSDNGLIADNRVLLVKNLTKVESAWDLNPSDTRLNAISSISLNGEAVLVLGTDLADGDDVASLRKGLYEVVNTSKIVTGSLSKATLITSNAPRLEEGFSIVVGEQVSTEKKVQNGIHIGNDGRWIVYFDDQGRNTANQITTSLNDVVGLTQSTVTAEKDAELILFNWNGQPFSIGDFSAENVHAFGGARVVIKDGIATRLWCKDFDGLRASSVVGYVETSDKAEAFKALPGYRFISDTFDEQIVGRDAYANVIDGAVFLPLTSGIAAAGERVFADMLETVMTHDLSLFEGKSHWWVDGESAKKKAGDIFSGGSGTFGFEADVITGTLGYDFTVGERWTATAAVSFAGIDTQSKGAIENTTGDMSMAGVLLSAARDFDDYTLRLAVAYSRASGDVEQRAVAHRQETDADVEFLSAAARFTSHMTTASMHLSPYVQIAINGARFHDGVITDSTTDGSVSGEAFKTSFNNRLWATLEAGSDMSCLLEVGQYKLKPSLGIALRSGFGQTEWKIRSTLFDGAGSTETAYDSAQRFAARVRATLELASSGFHEVSPGVFTRHRQARIEPYAWQLLLRGEYETASNKERSSALSLEFKQLF